MFESVISSAKKIAFFINAVCIVLMFFLAVAIVYDAVMRSFGHPTIWVFETSTYAFTFIGFLGNLMAVRGRVHFRVTFLRDILPSMARGLDILSDLSVVLFGVLLIIAGSYFTMYLYTNHVVSTTLLQTPLWLPSLAIPVGGIGLAVQTLADMSIAYRTPVAKQMDH